MVAAWNDAGGDGPIAGFYQLGKLEREGIPLSTGSRGGGIYEQSAVKSGWNRNVVEAVQDVIVEAVGQEK